MEAEATVAYTLAEIKDWTFLGYLMYRSELVPRRWCWLAALTSTTLASLGATDDRSDAGLVEQRRGECADVGVDLVLELGGFAGCGLDAAGEAAQHEPHSELVGCGRAAAETAAAVEQPAEWQTAQLVAEGLCAVTITLRRCTSASRRTSTALRRAISSSRSASQPWPERGKASLSLASAARAIRIASSESSLPAGRRSALGVRLIASTASPCSLRKRASPAQ